MLLNKKSIYYDVVVGVMGEQANIAHRVVYKGEWFYKYLPMLHQRMEQNHLVCEFQPWYQGYVEEKKLVINGERACAVIKGMHTKIIPGTNDMQIVATMVAAGPQSMMLQSLLQNDPKANDWEFRLRCLFDDEVYLAESHSSAGPVVGKTLIPIVTKVITWDLFLK